MLAMPAAQISEPVHVLALLLAVLASLFAFASTPVGKRVFGVLPILLFCYFVPTLLSNTGVIPSHGDFALYDFVTQWLLPASLLLLIMSVDIPAILGLGRNVMLLFAAAVGSIILGGPLAFLALGWAFDPETADEVWRGLAALSGSWIGGAVNMTAIKESVGASDEIVGAIVVVDVAIAETWTAGLFLMAAREMRLDARIGADRRALEQLQARTERFHAEVQRPLDLGSLLVILAVAFGATVLAHELSAWIAARVPENNVFTTFAWKVLVITALGVGLSFTRMRRLEGAGASQIGLAMLYLLVATIGAKAQFAEVAKAENLPLIAVAGLWIVLHVAALWLVRRWLAAPIFLLAVSSRACIGGAASTSIVAAAFNPVLVPVGVMLAMTGYVVGTLGGFACAWLLRAVHAGMW